MRVSCKRIDGHHAVMLFFCVCMVIMCLVRANKAACSDEPPIDVLFFYSEECEDCHFVEEFILGPLREIYPVNVIRVSVDEKEGYERLLFMEEITGSSEKEIPAVFVGNKGMGGVEEIESMLEPVLVEIIETSRDEDHTYTLPPRKPVEQPQRPERPSPGEPARPQEIPKPQEPLKPAPPRTGEEAGRYKVYAAYFSKQGCTQCSRAYRDLAYLQSKYPNFIVRVYDIADQEGTILSEALGQIFGVPEKKRLTAPAVFIGMDFLLDDDIRVDALEALILKYGSQETQPPWEMADATRKRAGESIVSRFRGLNLTTIIVAGLLDGINPCAFATIIFFISYLAYIGRKGREILLVGCAFTLAVFVTYMLIGLGFLSFVRSLAFLPMLSKIVYGATAAFALVLGILSLKDYVRCRKGDIGDMSLQLPDFLKRRIHKTIREETKVKRYILGALITGIIISILELACTGQVYLPTIIFVSRISALRLRSILYLFLYNLMFITPLVVIFVTVYKGTSSQQLTALFRRSSAGIKLGMAALFFTLAGILIATLL